MHGLAAMISPLMGIQVAGSLMLLLTTGFLVIGVD
jgi:hypothetical protein